MTWPIGCKPVASIPSLWNPPACIGYLCSRILEGYGFEVYLVNARHVKTVPGRKTDILDCQWLQQLHSFGLLAASKIRAQKAQPQSTGL